MLNPGLPAAAQSLTVH